MATLDINGMELVKGMEIGLSQLEISDDFFLQYSGLRFSYDPTKPVGGRVDIASIRVNGKKWSPSATYSVTVNTGIAMLLPMLGVNVENLVYRDELEYDVVKAYIRRMRTVVAHSEGRIIEHACKSKQLAAAMVGASTVSAYPNPFNPATTVSVSLPSEGRLIATMYNSIGQEVGRLADGEFEAGVHEFRWDASAMPAGVYFCRVSAAQTNGMVKVLLVK
jgi:hypothetical protein